VARRLTADRFGPLHVDYTLQRRHQVAFLRPGTRLISGCLGLAWGGDVAFLARRRPGGHAWVVLTKRAQNMMFSGRTECSQARYGSSQVRTSRHSHQACAGIDAVPRYRARCSRAPTVIWTIRIKAAPPPAPEPELVSCPDEFPVATPTGDCVLKPPKFEQLVSCTKDPRKETAREVAEELVARYGTQGAYEHVNRMSNEETSLLDWIFGEREEKLTLADVSLLFLAIEAIERDEWSATKFLARIGLNFGHLGVGRRAGRALR
jgi:hypothetical protein